MKDVIRQWQDEHNFLIEDAIRTWFAEKDISWLLWPCYVRALKLISIPARGGSVHWIMFPDGQSVKVGYHFNENNSFVLERRHFIYGTEL